jgi:DNA-binding response OmpR family regulator
MFKRKLKSRILVADDEELIADTLALILNLNGFEATAVYSGEDAVQMAPKLKPDVLISDVNMGRMSGVDAAIQIRRQIPQCCVLLISARSLTDDRIGQFESEGFHFEFLDKPFNPCRVLDFLSDQRKTNPRNLSH